MRMSGRGFPPVRVKLTSIRSSDEKLRSHRETRSHHVPWQFVRHFAGMSAAMLVGMAAFGLVSSHTSQLSSRTDVELAAMAMFMTVPMVLWMRRHGHGWRSCNEMAAAMGVPATGAIALLTAGIVTDPETLIVGEHTLMFPAMLVIMVLRRDEYSGERHPLTSSGSSRTVCRPTPARRERSPHPVKSVSRRQP